MNQIKFISGLNPKFIRNGFFVVKNAGLIFQNREDIPMVGQEN